MTLTTAAPFKIRKKIKAGDDKIIGRLLSQTGVFSREEISLGRELAEESLYTDNKSFDYHFLFAEDRKNNIAGFACYGRIPLTEKCWDFYWMAVDPAFQRRGLATLLTDAVGATVKKKGGVWLFAEVSSLHASAPIRRCHKKNGFKLMAKVPDFYKDGDDKLLYRKNLNQDD